jgi:hypothetical protein
MFRGFVSIDWGHVKMEADLIPNPSKNMHTYLNQLQKAIKSRPSPDAWCVSANAYMKTVLQALQDYTLTIWEGRNAVLYAKTHDTELIFHAQLNADIWKIYKLKDSFADSAKQYFHLPLEELLTRSPSNRPQWLHLARLVAARARGHGTGEQSLSTFYLYKPSSCQARSTLPSTLAMPP